ncbi:MAG: hypothetical protein KatS3mg003_1873 [Candidatus Nitrosocaldaceae archaeon]|nr:MAG: hypothetical protein KatS3mg003_1873 [Candidatus Nitrosocaldaceae archaeon]
MSNITLEMIYEEIKSIKQLLEELAEKSIINIMPEESIDENELEEIEAIEKEGEYITLDEAIKKHIKNEQI